MNGLQHTSIQPNGRQFLKLALITLAMLFLCGCSPDWWVGDGRGDWTLDLREGYAISKINSHEILFVHKDNPNDTGGTIVIPNYFIVTYQIHKQFICLEGIRTQGPSVSEEELDEMQLSYYLVNTNDGKVEGPYEDYDSFVNYCISVGVEIQRQGTVPCPDDKRIGGEDRGRFA